MFKIAQYIIGAGLVIGATAASAGDLMPDSADGVMNSCRSDYHRMCSYVVPGNGRAARCLLDHEMDLTPACLSAIKIATSVEACMPDYRRFCPGVPAGPQAFQCLADRMDMLVPQCRRVVSANAPYMLPQGEQYGYNRGPAPYDTPNPGGYAYRDGPPDEDRYASEGAPQQWSGGGYAYRNPPQYEDPGANESAPRATPYDDRYAGRGYPERDYDYGAPRDPYQPEEEREPAR
ncbi:MAG: hypothetical protein ACLPWS_07470 [Rhodomicrobium sp.]